VSDPPRHDLTSSTPSKLPATSTNPIAGGYSGAAAGRAGASQLLSAVGCRATDLLLRRASSHSFPPPASTGDSDFTCRNPEPTVQANCGREISHRLRSSRLSRFAVTWFTLHSDDAHAGNEQTLNRAFLKPQRQIMRLCCHAVPCRVRAELLYSISHQPTRHSPPDKSGNRQPDHQQRKTPHPDAFATTVSEDREPCPPIADNVEGERPRYRDLIWRRLLRNFPNSSSSASAFPRGTPQRPKGAKALTVC
jgi:hypothetical protein